MQPHHEISCRCGCVPSTIPSLFEMACKRGIHKASQQRCVDLIQTHKRHDHSTGNIILDLQGLQLTTQVISHKTVFSRVADSLTELHLDHNMLTEFPTGVFPLLKMLNSLSLHYNLLTSLPEDIGALMNLKECRLDNNRLESLPDEIGACNSLIFLHLDGNTALTKLPESLGNLSNLHHILMSRVNVSSLPRSMFRCSALEFICHDDVLVDPPAGVMRDGGDAIRAYLKNKIS